jgi:hypothetical protein
VDDGAGSSGQAATEAELALESSAPLGRAGSGTGFETSEALGPAGSGAGFETSEALGPAGSGAGFETSEALGPAGSGAGFETSEAFGPAGSGAGFETSEALGPAGSGAGFETSEVYGPAGSGARLETTEMFGAAGSGAGVEGSQPSASAGSGAGFTDPAPAVESLAFRREASAPHVQDASHEPLSSPISAPPQSAPLAQASATEPPCCEGTGAGEAPAGDPRQLRRWDGRQERAPPAGGSGLGVDPRDTIAFVPGLYDQPSSIPRGANVATANPIGGGGSERGIRALLVQMLAMSGVLTGAGGMAAAAAGAGVRRQRSSRPTGASTTPVPNTLIAPFERDPNWTSAIPPPVPVARDPGPTASVAGGTGGDGHAPLALIGWLDDEDRPALVAIPPAVVVDQVVVAVKPGLRGPVAIRGPPAVDATRPEARS